jgi:hypothetical protein
LYFLDLFIQEFNGPIVSVVGDMPMTTPSWFQVLDLTQVILFFGFVYSRIY